MVSCFHVGDSFVEVRGGLQGDLYTQESSQILHGSEHGVVHASESKYRVYVLI